MHGRCVPKTAHKNNVRAEKIEKKYLFLVRTFLVFSLGNSKLFCCCFASIKCGACDHKISRRTSFGGDLGTTTTTASTTSDLQHFEADAAHAHRFVNGELDDRNVVVRAAAAQDSATVTAV